MVLLAMIVGGNGVIIVRLHEPPREAEFVPALEHGALEVFGDLRLFVTCVCHRWSNPKSGQTLSRLSRIGTNFVPIVPNRDKLCPDCPDCPESGQILSRLAEIILFRITPSRVSRDLCALEKSTTEKSTYVDNIASPV